MADPQQRIPRDTPDTNEVTRVDNSPVSGLTDTKLGGRYHLERLIGSGGMAQVWEATDLVLGRRVAVKVLHPHLAVDDAFVARFRQEAVAAARLSHPGIVGVYDTCSDGPYEAIVMELLDALTLRQHLDDHGPLDAETTVRIALRLLDALEAAHRAGLVHRDVKPSNILLCRDGRVKIADFGIAKSDDQTELTQEGTLVGTATYLAPEQLLGDKVDGRTDLYSLGIVLYECLTGRVPFRGETGAAVALARLHSDPVDPRRVRADVPPSLSAPIMRVLSRDPDQRYDSAADLRAALLDTGMPPLSTTPAPPAETEDEPTAQNESFARSERSWMVPTLFILLVATAITVAGLLLRETTIDSEDPPATSVPTEPSSRLVPFSDVVPVDPQGRGEPGENDQLAASAHDGDPTTSWRTETYNDSPDFSGSKAGVGLALIVGEPTQAIAVAVDGSTNGWSAQLYLLDQAQIPAEGLSEFDPDEFDPVAVLEDVRGPVRVALGGREVAENDVILVWITNLGDPVDSDRYRVQVNEVALEGRGTGE